MKAGGLPAAPSPDRARAVRASLSPAEWALAECIRMGAPCDRSYDWQALLRHAVTHNVVPLLYQVMSSGKNDVPVDVLNDVTQVRRQSALKTAFALRQRDNVLGLLDGAGIPCLVLKGAALARTWYGDPSLRPFADIDLLLPPNDVARARGALLQAGYRESCSLSAAPHHETPLSRDGMPCAIELHHGLTPLPLRHALSFEELLARSITLDSEGSRVQTLGPEDTLMHLCMHLLVHVGWTHGWQLRHLHDVARHLAVFAIDWHVFEERVHQLGARRACGAVLGLASLLAGAKVPPEHVDNAGTLELLCHSMTGIDDDRHHFLAAFCAAVARADLRDAGGLLLRTMVDWNKGGKLRLRDLRPHLLGGILVRLLLEAVTQPRRIRSQVRAWLPEAENLSRRERLVADLLNSPNVSDASRTAAGETVRQWLT